MILRALEGEMRLEVHKLGGTSVGTAERIRAAAQLIDGVAGGCRAVVVSSAMAGVTDALVGAASLAGAGRRADALAAVDALRARHLEVAREPGVRDEVDALCDELGELILAAGVLGELTPRSRDRLLATGEKLAVRLVAEAVRARGRLARALDADTFLETDDAFGEANPVGGVADRRVQAAILAVLGAGCVPIVTGYCGRAPDGATTTLGRGGSDLSATLLAAALDADQVTIWTDVDGVYSADPRAVPEARVIRQLNYREAAEMSYYGAKVLHQRTMIPVARRGIPVWTRNSFRPAAPGTVVDGRFTPGSHPVKAITAVRGQALISVEGKGMAGVPGVAARVFGSLAAAGISVTMISQSSSEASICLAVPDVDADRAEQALKRDLMTEMSRGDIEELVVRAGVGLVAAVGLGMAQTPGVAARTFQALATHGINVLAIAQGSSELNLSLAVDEKVVPDALRAVHHEFGLDRLDPGADGGRFMDLLLLGCGGIGRTLLRQIRHGRGFERFGLVPRVIAVADRSGYLLRPAGLDDAELDALVAAKETGRPLASLPGARVGDATEMVEDALQWRLARPVLVDVSDADTDATFARALALRCDVATANKRPLAGDAARYRALRQAADARGGLLKAEATVGAGLPVVDTLETLLQTGDAVRVAEGSLSGTLGFVMTRLGQGARLSQAVAEAVAHGYTEPDPVQDLSGADVARKAVILSRWAGLGPDDAEVALTGLVDPTWAGTPVPELLERLRAELDEPMARRIQAARAAGRALRFVARVSADGIEVGPMEVPAGSALGMLEGTDNLILFRTERYAQRPLVVIGPGAGVEVTAMGVLGDILRIAAVRSG